MTLPEFQLLPNGELEPIPPEDIAKIWLGDDVIQTCYKGEVITIVEEIWLEAE